ncbi:PTS fructose transporter subunit IIC [Azospirillaceae bacterium]
MKNIFKKPIKTLMVLALIAIWSIPAPAHAGLIRDAGQSCAFGAGVFGVTSFIGVTPTLITSVLTVPTTSVILGNAMVGCVIGAAGATAAKVFTWMYDLVW